MTSSGEELVDHDAECSVLGTILLDQRAMDHLHDTLPSDFADVRHRAIFQAIAMMRQRNAIIDPVTVSTTLREMNRLDAVGGMTYLLELTAIVVSGTSNVAEHAIIIRDLAQRRRFADMLGIASTRISMGEPKAMVWSDLSKELNSHQAQMGGASLVAGDLDPLLSAIERRISGQERPLPTPWRSVSHALGGGLWPGMTIFVGGTGSGKTQWAVQASLCAAEAGARVLYLALELDELELCARFVGAAARVPWSDFLRGRIPPTAEVITAMSTIQKLPIFRECGVPLGYGPDALTSRAWAIRPQFVVVDFLQLCGTTGNEDMRVAVARMAYACRRLARDMGCVVLALSSTSRQNYKDLVIDTEKKEPRDFVGTGKETGETEYAADNVLVLGHHPTLREQRVLVVAKQRAGMGCFVGMQWSGTHFSDLPDEGQALARAAPEAADNVIPFRGHDDDEDPF